LPPFYYRSTFPVNEILVLYNMSKSGLSRSAPLQNMSVCTGCVANPVRQFSSASEVAEFKKRSVTAAFYNNPSNIYPIKNRYSSIVTTYKGAEAQSIPVAASTCCPGLLGAISDGKDTPFFLYNKFNPT
jgi:hypothetical protein